jgi:EAL and modified HD-GYP domain-containing signal transduction protein
LLARQPIMDESRRVLGYELLYRGLRESKESFDTTATARVICETLSHIGAERVVGPARMFINLGQDLLESGAVEVLASVLPAGQGVIEILEGVEASAEGLKAVARLRSQGVLVALDDFAFQPGVMPFLDHADYVKVDVLAAGARLGSLADRLKPLGIPLIAEKVESLAVAKTCADLGFQYFQGYFFARPEEQDGERVGVQAHSVITLLSELQRPEGAPAKLAETIGRDVALSHQILRLANSAAFRRRRAVSSLIDAVVLLGQDVIRQWASLLLMARLATHKPRELLSMALVRARLCQKIGEPLKEIEPNVLFTAGLLSVLDALLDKPMVAVVNELPLGDNLRDALLGEKNSKLAMTLRRAIACETGQWDTLAKEEQGEAATLLEAYVEALEFARRTLAAS